MCAEKLQKAKSRSTSFLCITHRLDLKCAFGIDIDLDNIQQHPEIFCMCCYKKMKRMCMSQQEATPYRTTVVLFNWTPHTQHECTVSNDTINHHIISLYYLTLICLQVCAHFDALSRGGRGRKSSKGKGRPKGITPKMCINNIKEVAPSPLLTSESVPKYIGNVHTSLECTVCMEVLQGPVELPCGQLICASCLTKSIATLNSTKCPCCYTCNLAENAPTKPPQIVLDLLAELHLECKRCHTSVAAGSYQAHLDAGCTAPTPVPDSPTIKEVLSAPDDSPVTPMERKAAGQVIQRIIQQGESGQVIQIATKGKVCTQGI